MTFHRLDVKAIYSWDESLFATRAFYLAHHGEYFTNWRDIDFSSLNHPNTKPPLVGLIQAGFFKVFGYTRMALRTPIVIMGLLLAMLLAQWMRKMQLSWHYALVAFLVLLSSNGFNYHHIMRTGDHDTALALWLTLSIFSFWAYEFFEKKNKWLLLFFFFTALAVLTKSIMGFMMLPAIALYALIFTPFVKTLKNPFLYLGLGLMLGLIALFYGVIEKNHPGFLQLVWDNEVGGRYAETIDNHAEPWYYYLWYFYFKGFTPYWIFTLIGIYFGLKSDNIKLRKATILIGISAFFYLIVISSAGTKLPWYAAPLYPLFTILTAIGLVKSANEWAYPLLEKLLKSKLKKQVVTSVFLFLLIAPGIVNVLQRNAREHTSYNVEEYELALDKLHKEHPEYNNLRIHSKNEWYPSLVFVANKYSKIYNYEIELITSKDDVAVGDLLFGEYHPRMEPYKMEKLAEYFGDIKLYRIISLKKDHKGRK